MRECAFDQSFLEFLAQAFQEHGIQFHKELQDIHHLLDDTLVQDE